jgi:FeS assembly protein IscX
VVVHSRQRKSEYGFKICGDVADTDPKYVRFVDLRKWVLALDEFDVNG